MPGKGGSEQMSGHTPGPWVAGNPGSDYIVTASDGRRFLIGDSIYHPENEANARLIAAAPEMLAALKKHEELKRRIHAGEAFVLDDEFCVLATAAIAKAEGR